MKKLWFKYLLFTVCRGCCAGCFVVDLFDHQVPFPELLKLSGFDIWPKVGVITSRPYSIS